MISLKMKYYTILFIKIMNFFFFSTESPPKKILVYFLNYYEILEGGYELL